MKLREIMDLPSSEIDDDTEYAKFLYKNNFQKKKPIKEFTSIYPPNGDDRSIYEEIFKKFNNNGGKIDQVTFSKPPDLGGYWVVSDMEKPNQKIKKGMGITKTSIPEPKTMAHETVHATDHQMDGMTPDIWKKLQELREKYTNDTDFTNTLLNIQGKIQKGFFDANAYNPSIGAKNDAIADLNRFDQEINKAQKEQYNSTTDWSKLLPEMNNLVSYQPNYKRSKSSSLPNKNPYFKGQYASEFPAFALTNLTNSWKTDQGENPVDSNGQEFLHDILGNMEQAYPANDYPTVNNYIRQRRNSITNTDTWKQNHPIISQLGSLDLVNLPLKRITENPNPEPTKIAKFAGGGYVSGNNSYDPYLNTYNYPEPLRLSEYLTDQMPDSGYDETGGYNDPYMSYENGYDDDGQQYSFREGGSVGDEDLPKLADLIRRHGRNGDTELAHINPIEAHILKSLGGSGTINPATGLREYSFWKKPWKAIRSVIGGGAGALLGNMILPGAGGIIGGAIGQGAQNAIRGKDPLQGALKGAGMGAALPSMASGLGWGASKLGATALGSSLSNYGTTNAILPALGLGGSGSSSGLFGLGGSNPYVNGGLSAATALSSGMGTGRGQGLGVSSGDYAENYYNYMLDRQKKQDNMGFTDKLQDYLTQPSNLLTLGTTAAQYLGREKPKSPEKIAEEERRYRNASRKTIAEVEADEALEIARKDLKKKHKNKRLDEDIKNMGSVRRRVVSPEEFARTGRWLEYEDDEGRPVRMKSGGLMRSPYDYLVEEVRYPTASPLHYLNGDSGGQDDLIDAKLSDGEYVIDAATVADLGDGNNAAGARKLDNFRRNIREHKRGGKITLPPRAKSLQSYLMG
jgi:hypothetical protein